MSSAPSTPDPTPSPEVIEAAAWLSLRDRGMSAAETAEFVRWLQQDPQHAAVFSEFDAVWKDFDRLGAVATPTPPTAAPDADALAPRPRVRRHPALAWGAAGIAAAALVAISFITFASPQYTAETAVGAFQKIDLPDGSVAQLNTDSAIDTEFTHHERRVRIVRGEVFFTVTKDPARPFIVTSGPVAVRAVGTAFNVRQRSESVEVLVTEGRVRVDDAEAGRSFLPAPDPARSEPPLLVAGERATVALAPGTASPSAALATVVALTRPATQRFLAWQERRLEFEAEPLDEVVREFNRYNHRKLVIADPRLSSKRFSGTFRADGYESLVRLLEQDFGVAAVTREREIVLRSKE